MRWLVVVAAVLLGGCIRAELVECSDGRMCPRGTACDVAHGLCVAPDQLTACDGLDEFAACQATGVEAGRCFAGVCLPGGCGNGLLEPEELCDDGNRDSGDGCSADCLSTEECGDGFVNTLLGEECDDGNKQSRDGCTNACTLEQPVWQERPEERPLPRARAGIAYHELYQRIVVFGGVDDAGVGLDDTWELDGGGWVSHFAGGPMRRSSPGITYDPVHHRVVMFGGYSSTTQGVLLNDTWEWNGVDWQRRTSISAPPARVKTALAWDGHRVIMFGGSQLDELLGDTWAWDGETWTRLDLATAPSPREGHAMVYEPMKQRIVLVGGQTQPPSLTTQTWVFDGTAWKLLPAKLPRLNWAGLAYDARRGVVVLSGVETATNRNTVWELEGDQWVDKQPDAGPGNYDGAALAYDAVRGRVVQFGGRRLTSFAVHDEMWEWDGLTWTSRSMPEAPPARHYCAMASNPVTGRVVMFGGHAGRTPLGDTWLWNGREWKEVHEDGPSRRYNAAMAFDGATRAVLLFGGEYGEIHGDTWLFDGAHWEQVATTGPPPRHSHSMAYDARRNRVWLFGGKHDQTTLGDLWSWDGATKTWTLHEPASGPSARSKAGLAYDIAGDRVVLFGGIGEDGTKLTDTWTWNGTAWTDITAVVRPEGRSDFNLVYDRKRQRVMLFGGVNSGFSLWELDGNEWSQPDASLVPLMMTGACATYDDARTEIVAFGGERPLVSAATAIGSYRGDLEEVCRTGEDIDGDGAAGCDDDDCRTVCAPLCWDDPTCTLAPACGDGVCSKLEFEHGACCPADCGP